MDKNKTDNNDRKEDDPDIIASEAKQSQSEEVKREDSKIWEDKYKRALADYQNLQRNTQEQRVEWIRMAGKEIILKLLPVLDTLILAQKHLGDKGLQLSIDQFLNILKDEGATQIKTVGEKFDPNLMNCVTTKDGEEGKVLEEVSPGFTMNESLIRPALVIVGKGK